MMIPKKIKLHVIFKSPYEALGWAAVVASTHTAQDDKDLCSLESLLNISAAVNGRFIVECLIGKSENITKLQHYKKSIENR